VRRIIWISQQLGCLIICFYILIKLVLFSLVVSYQRNFIRFSEVLLLNVLPTLVNLQIKQGSCPMNSVGSKKNHGIGSRLLRTNHLDKEIGRCISVLLPLHSSISQEGTSLLNDHIFFFFSCIRNLGVDQENQN